MAKKQYININFPFQDSTEGNFVELNQTDEKAVKADIVHIILTQKGERLYLPDFGTNLRRFLFEPQDGITENDIQREIKDVLGKYIPNLTVDSVNIENSEDERFTYFVRLDYTITDDVFESKDFVAIQL